MLMTELWGSVLDDKILDLLNFRYGQKPYRMGGKIWNLLLKEKKKLVEKKKISLFFFKAFFIRLVKILVSVVKSEPFINYKIAKY